MVLEQNLYGIFQERYIERPLDLKHQCLIVVMWINDFLLEEPALNGTERNRSGYGALFCLNRFARACDCNQLCDCLVLENLLRSEPEPRLARSGDDLDAENGITAKLKKIVVDADLREIQSLTPDFRQRFLRRSTRGDKFRFQAWSFMDRRR